MEIENKLSVVIPTILANKKVLEKLLTTLEADIFVDEIILINNTKKTFAFKSNKIKLINPKENLFVNESWNVGIKIAKNNFCAILNDDLILSNDFFKQISAILKKLSRNNWLSRK